MAECTETDMNIWKDPKTVFVDLSKFKQLPHTAFKTQNMCLSFLSLILPLFKWLWVQMDKL